MIERVKNFLGVRAILDVLVGGLLLAAVVGLVGTCGAKKRIAAPTTRYHGYALNREAIAKARGFTVLISNEGFGGVSRGTGVLLDDRRVLTCAHLAKAQGDDL